MEYQVNAEGDLVRKHVAHPTTPAYQRWLDKIKVSSVHFFGGVPCWEWTGCKSKTTGYGQFRVDGRRGRPKKIGSHVFAYLHFEGEIPEGFEVNHKCYNRACCNPMHLDLKTHKQNIRDPYAKSPASINARKTHCKAGHALEGDNLHITPRGSRLCRTCNARRQREFQARRKAEFA